VKVYGERIEKNTQLVVQPFGGKVLAFTEFNVEKEGI